MLNKKTIAVTDEDKVNLPLPVSLERDSLIIGNFSLNLQRTLRVPDDGKGYGLPIGLGPFPMRPVSELPHAPNEVKERGGFILPMYQCEAAWLNFQTVDDMPVAVKVLYGGVNALTGKADHGTELVLEPQNYMVVPGQPWLDGVKVAENTVRQIVAAAIGGGVTIEAQVTGEEKYGGIQIIVIPMTAKALRKYIASRPLNRDLWDDTLGEPMGLMFLSASVHMPVIRRVGASMGVAAGGKIDQKIYDAEIPPEDFNQNRATRVWIHVANSLAWREITGEEAPATPVTQEEYKRHNMPWFKLYDEGRDDIGATEEAGRLKSMQELQAEKGIPITDEWGNTAKLPDKYAVDAAAKLEEHPEDTGQSGSKIASMPPGKKIVVPEEPNTWFDDGQKDKK